MLCSLADAHFASLAINHMKFTEVCVMFTHTYTLRNRLLNFKKFTKENFQCVCIIEHYEVHEDLRSSLNFLKIPGQGTEQASFLLDRQNVFSCCLFFINKITVYKSSQESMHNLNYIYIYYTELYIYVWILYICIYINDVNWIDLHQWYS